MNDLMKGFGQIAGGLARNPLGIIALFLVLVYGLAALVTAFAGSLSATERMPLIYFLVGFPVLVLVVFAWLVSRHSGKLYAPGDFKDEDNYVKMQLSAVASLAVATTKKQEPHSESEIHHIVDVVRDMAPPRGVAPGGLRNHVLWVDDRREHNIYERLAFEAVGLRFSLALSTKVAIDLLAKQRFAAVISDMGRREGPRRLRPSRYPTSERDQTPLIFYASSSAPEHRRETLEHGGQGCTERAQELFQMVMKAVIGNNR